MVGAAVAAAVGRLNLEASGNITKIRVANPDPHGSRTGPVFALFEMFKLQSNFLKRLM